MRAVSGLLKQHVKARLALVVAKSQAQHGDPNLNAVGRGAAGGKATAATKGRGGRLQAMKAQSSGCGSGVGSQPADVTVPSTLTEALAAAISADHEGSSHGVLEAFLDLYAAEEAAMVQAEGAALAGDSGAGNDDDACASGGGLAGSACQQAVESTVQQITGRGWLQSLFEEPSTLCCVCEEYVCDDYV